MSRPNDLYDSEYLKRFHSLTLQCHNHNLVVVCSWFIEMTNPKIQRFYAKNYRHNKKDKEALLNYIRSKYKEISALSFNNRSTIKIW